MKAIGQRPRVVTGERGVAVQPPFGVVEQWLGEDERLPADSVEAGRRLVARDYFVESAHRTLDTVIGQLAEVSDVEIREERVALRGVLLEAGRDEGVRLRRDARALRRVGAGRPHRVERERRLRQVRADRAAIAAAPL